MTDEQFVQLLELLERIAVALEPVHVTRPPHVPPGSGRRMQIDQIVTNKIEELVKSTALKPKKT